MRERNQANSNRSLKWCLNQKNIKLDNKVKMWDRPIRGIYGIFVGDKGEDKCVYIGKSTNIYRRMFSNGHITKLMKNNHSNVTLKVSMAHKKQIHIRVMKEVPFIFDDYCKDVQRLASWENKYIDYYQEINQCLEQVPEGTKITKGGWEGMGRGVQ